MIVKKVCMLGSFAVGKTSLVSQFVHSKFSEKYLSTLGVKIDKKVVETDQGTVNMQIWDFAGDDDYQKLSPAKLRGSGGCLMVVDGTRAATLDHAQQLLQRLDRELAPIPVFLLLNKWDLQDSWELEEGALAPFQERGIPIRKTSAKTGENVELAFQTLGKAMLERM